MSMRDWPIERKFFAGTLLITLTAITSLSAFLILAELRSVRDVRIADTKAFAGMIATNAGAALIYDDENVARQVLSGVSADPDASAAALYKTNGQLYAWYPPSLDPATLPVHPAHGGVQYGPQYITVFADVLEHDEVVGTAYLRMDLSALRQRFRGYVITAAAFAAGAVLLVLLLANLLQRWIARPLISLSRTAKNIADQGNYALRAEKEGGDEIGELVDAFNHMVEEVQGAQQKLKNYATDLEVEVADRTSRLRETISELEAFSYSVSHDMRAPLRAMQGYAQILLEEAGAKLTSEQSDYLVRIMRSAARLDALIQDILLYSRISRTDMELTAVNLDRVVNDVLSEYPQFSKNQSNIEVVKPLGVVRGHAAALSQVFSNLLGNGCKFVLPGVPPRIRVWSEAHGDRRRVCVEDNGVGIPDKDLQRIFRIFERVHDGRMYEGTGIGLSIVKKAVEKMGGTVGVASKVGVGSTFWFELPDATTAVSNTGNMRSIASKVEQ